MKGAVAIFLLFCFILNSYSESLDINSPAFKTQANAFLSQLQVMLRTLAKDVEGDFEIQVKGRLALRQRLAPASNSSANSLRSLSRDSMKNNGLILELAPGVSIATGAAAASSSLPLNAPDVSGGGGGFGGGSDGGGGGLLLVLSSCYAVSDRFFRICRRRRWRWNL